MRDMSARTPQDRDRDRNWAEEEEAIAEYDAERNDRYDQYGDGWLTKLTEDIAIASAAGLEEGELMRDEPGTEEGGMSSGMHSVDPPPCALCHGYGDVVNPGNADPAVKVTDWLAPVGCPRCGQTGKDPNP